MMADKVSLRGELIALKKLRDDLEFVRDELRLGLTLQNNRNLALSTRVIKAEMALESIKTLVEHLGSTNSDIHKLRQQILDHIQGTLVIHDIVCDHQEWDFLKHGRHCKCG